MIRISELLGKSLISLYDAKSVGYISNVWFDEKLLRAKVAEITNDEDDYPEKAFAEIRQIGCEGDAAVIKNYSAISLSVPSAAMMPCPVNRSCFNQSGKALGKVRDIELDDCTVKNIICDGGEFSPKELLSVSDTLCIFNDTGEPIKLARGKSKPKHNVGQSPCQNAGGVQTPYNPQSVTVTRMPGEPVKDYSFLMGKPVHTPVISGDRILIPAGAIVNESIIELCRRENKLVQLALRAY